MQKFVQTSTVFLREKIYISDFFQVQNIYS